MRIPLGFSDPVDKELPEIFEDLLVLARRVDIDVDVPSSFEVAQHNQRYEA